MSLFREEVLRARTVACSGVVRVGHPPRLAIAAAAAIVLAATLLAFAVVGKVTRKARVAGVLVPVHGSLHIATPQPGRIAELRVREGEVVTKGQVLMVIDVDHRSIEGPTGDRMAETLARRRDALESELRLARRHASQREVVLEARARSLALDREHADADVESTAQGVALATRTIDRFRGLVEAGFVSQAQAQSAQESLLAAQRQERQARRVATALTREAEAVRAEQSDHVVQSEAQAAQIQRALAALDQETLENHLRRRVVLTAQADASVAALNVHLGQTVGPGHALATLLPADEGVASHLEAHLDVPTRQAGFIEPGQWVKLRYDAFPHQKFGTGKGRVTAVSRSPIDRSPATGAPPEPIYRVTVQLMSQSIGAYGRPVPLKAGMTLQADIVQDRRAIWEWFLGPLLSVSRSGT